MVKKKFSGIKKEDLDFPKKVGIIYSDVKRKYFPTESQYLTEKDADKDAQVIAKYLNKIGIEAILYAGDSLLTQKLRRDKPEMVFNLVDSVKGSEALSSSIPGVLELLEIPYTGADILGKSLDTNKFLVKKLLQQNGIPIPHCQLFNSPNDILDPTLRFPLISKLNEIHGSVEITKDAVSETEKELRERLKFLIGTYRQAVIVEEFIVGREVTGFLLDGLNKKVYLAEKVFNMPGEKFIFLDFESQWKDKEGKKFYYQKFKDNLLKEYIKRAFEIIGLYDYGKFDVRLDESGRYYFLDCNANPSFGPKETDCALGYILDLYNIPFCEVLKRLLINTMRDVTGEKLLPMPSNGTDD